MAKSTEQSTGAKSLKALLMPAPGLPLGFAFAHLVTPVPWWMEVRTGISLSGALGPAWFIIAASVLFAWGLLYTVVGLVFEARRASGR